MTDQQPDLDPTPGPDAAPAADEVPAASEVAAAATDAAPAPAADAPVAAAAVTPAAAATAAMTEPPTPVAPPAAPVAPPAAPVTPPPAPVAPVAPPAAPVMPPPDQGWGAYVPQASAAGPVAGWEYAGFWIRAVAYIIDGIILGFVTTILWVVVLMIAGAIGIGAAASGVDANGQLSDQQVAVLAVGFGVAILFLAIMSILVTFFYFTLLWVKRGGTFGQSVLGIRIARASDGGPIGWGTAIIRYIMMLISFWIFYLGVIWVAFEPRKRGWHDMVAGTLAVRRS